MDREQFRKAGYAAVDRHVPFPPIICDYFENIESYDVVPKVQPGDVAKLIADAAPQTGEPWEKIAQDFDRVILPGITHWQHPNFYAYFPANTTYECILADMYTGAVSNPGFNWLCSPACTELESKATDWVAKLLGLDHTWWNEGLVGGGVINGSAHESCLTVCIAARERYFRLHPGTAVSELVILVTTQTHSLAAKTALILGIDLVAIETKEEDDWALRGDGLRKALDELEGQGKKPFILVATLGSTSTGAIDKFSEITAVTADYPSLFLHIDAAWGGVFLSLPECQEETYLSAINARAPVSGNVEDGAICTGGEVHSISTNLHKSGLVTLDANCLWIRDRTLLTSALDVTPPYLRTPQASAGLVTDYRNMSVTLGRRFRSLKIWFTLRSYGVAGFQSHLRRIISLAKVFERTLLHAEKGVPGVVLFAPRRFSLVVFRVVALDTNGERPAADRLTHENALNAAMIRHANEESSLMLTPTTVGGKECVRVAIGSPHTEERHVRDLVEKIRALVLRARDEVAAKQ